MLATEHEAMKRLLVRAMAHDHTCEQYVIVYEIVKWYLKHRTESETGLVQWWPVRS